jgi:hypothetical protein
MIVSVTQYIRSAVFDAYFTRSHPFKTPCTPSIHTSA